MNDNLHETRIQKLENGHSVLASEHSFLIDSYKRLDSAIIKISESLTALVVLQEQDKAINKHIEKQTTLIESVDERLNNVELSLPQLIETRTWILVGLGIVICSVIMALVALVVK